MSRNPRVLLAVSAVLCLIFAASYLGQLWRLNRVQDALVAEQAGIKLAQQQNARLGDELAYVQSDEYTMQTARDELGQSQPGDQILLVLPEQPSVGDANSDNERVIANPAGKEAAATLTSQPSELIPNWQQWLLLFVDGV